MSIARSSLRIVARPGVWPRLRELLGPEMDTWLAEFGKRLPQEAEYLYTRRSGERVHQIALQAGSPYDLIASIRNAGEFDGELVWDIEQVLLRADSQYRKWDGADKSLARIIMPLLRN